MNQSRKRGGGTAEEQSIKPSADEKEQVSDASAPEAPEEEAVDPPAASDSSPAPESDLIVAEEAQPMPMAEAVLSLNACKVCGYEPRYNPGGQRICPSLSDSCPIL
jgi:hypothetical protein